MTIIKAPSNASTLVFVAALIIYAVIFGYRYMWTDPLSGFFLALLWGLVMTSLVFVWLRRPRPEVIALIALAGLVLPPFILWNRVVPLNVGFLIVAIPVAILFYTIGLRRRSDTTYGG